MTAPRLPEPREWKTCPRCGEEWLNLTQAGVCIQCEPEHTRSQAYQNNFKFPEVDRKSQSTGEDD